MKINMLSLSLGLGSLITVTISLACSYWFLFSVFGGDGYRAIGAGVAGCAIQLFSYGFSMFLPKETRLYMVPVWLVLCLMALTLSMFSTYTTIYSHITSSQEKSQQYEQGNQILTNLLLESQKDKELIRAAAEQGLSERYRTQAERLVQRNQEILKSDLKLMEKLDERIMDTNTATPMNGVLQIIGSSALVLAVFCVWLAFMFDALPLFALNAMSRAALPNTRHPDQRVTHIEPSNDSQKPSAADKTDNVVMETPEKVQKVSSAPNQKISIKKKSAAADDNKMASSTVIEALRRGTIEPNYASIQAFSGYSRWQAQDFCRKALEDNVIEREGRGFKMKEIQTIRVVSSMA